MIQYEKIELDYHLPIKLIDIYFEDHLTKTANKEEASIKTGDNSTFGIYASIALMATAGYVFLNKKQNA